MHNVVRLSSSTLSVTLFSAVAGFRINLLQGFLGFTNCTVSAVLQICEDSNVIWQMGCPSNTGGTAPFFDFGPVGIPATATNTSWRLAFAGGDGTVTAFFTATTNGL